MDNLMKVWVEQISLKHTQAECKRLGFQNIIFSFNPFAAHLPDAVKNQLLKDNSGTLAIPSGCTLNWQAMQVYLNKRFKAISRKCWEKYVSSVVKSFLEANSNSRSTVPLQKRQHMIDWTKERFEHVVQRWSNFPLKFAASIHEIILKFAVPLSINSAWTTHCETWRSTQKEAKTICFLLLQIIRSINPWNKKSMRKIYIVVSFCPLFNPCDNNFWFPSNQRKIKYTKLHYMPH